MLCIQKVVLKLVTHNKTHKYKKRNADACAYLKRNLKALKEPNA